MSAESVRKLRLSALAAVERSDWKKALACYEALEPLERGEGGWPHKAGDMYRRLARPAEALAAYGRAVEAYGRCGLLLKAIAVCKLMLEIDPRHTEAQGRLAALHASRLAEPTRVAGVPLARPARPLHEESLGRLVPGARPAAGLAPGPGDSALEIPLEADAPDPAALARGALPRTPLFSALSERQMRILIDQVRLVPLQEGEVLFRAGAPGDALYVVASGEVSVRTEDGREVGRLGEGAFFGEIALLVDQPRNATTVALAPTQLLAVDRGLMNGLLNESPALLRVLVRFVRDRLVGTLLETHPLFASLAPDARRALAARFRFLEAPAGVRVLEQGRPAAGLFVLLAGLASVSRDRGALALLAPGDLCGEMSLLAGGPATATVTVDRRSYLVMLPRADFEQAVTSHPRLRAYVTAVASGRRAPFARVTVV